MLIQSVRLSLMFVKIPIGEGCIPPPRMAVLSPQNFRPRTRSPGMPGSVRPPVLNIQGPFALILSMYYVCTIGILRPIIVMCDAKNTDSALSIPLQYSKVFKN